MLDQHPALVHKCFPLIEAIHKNMGSLKTTLDSQLLQDAPDLMNRSNGKKKVARGHTKTVSLYEAPKMNVATSNIKIGLDLYRDSLTRRTATNSSAKDIRGSLTTLAKNSLSAKDVRKMNK